MKSHVLEDANFVPQLTVSAGTMMNRVWRQKVNVARAHSGCLLRLPHLEKIILLLLEYCSGG